VAGGGHGVIYAQLRAKGFGYTVLETTDPTRTRPGSGTNAPDRRSTPSNVRVEDESRFPALIRALTVGLKQPIRCLKTYET